MTNFFKVFRERRDELIEAIKWTPFSRAEFNLANETFADSGSIDPETLDELERARRFYVICQQGRSSGSSVWRKTWRHTTSSKRNRTEITDWNDIDHLYWAAERFKLVQIEEKPVLDLIDHYDNERALFYIDPPYFHQKRWKNWLKAYRIEWSEEDHINLSDRLQEIKGMAIVSGYPCDLYEQIYCRRGWQLETTKAQTNNHTMKIEGIWISPNAQKHRQLRAF